MSVESCRSLSYRIRCIGRDAMSGAEQDICVLVVREINAACKAWNCRAVLRSLVARARSLSLSPSLFLVFKVVDSCGFFVAQ